VYPPLLPKFIEEPDGTVRALVILTIPVPDGFNVIL